jgi:PAS domain S-box-containing protein
LTAQFDKESEQDPHQLIARIRALESELSRLTGNFNEDSSYQAVFNRSDRAMVLIAPDGTIRDCNEKFCRLQGTRCSEFINSNVFSHFSHTGLADTIRLAKLNGSAKYSGLMFSDGNSSNNNLSMQFIWLGDEAGYYGFVEEVPDTTAGDPESGEIHLPVSTWIETFPAPVFLADHYGLITGCNEHTIRMCGFSRDEIVGRPVDEFLVSEKPELLDKSSYNGNIFCKDGYWLPVTVEIVMPAEFGENCLCIISEQTATNNNQNSDSHLQGALDHNPSGLMIVDEEWKLVYVNPRFEEICGLTISKSSVNAWEELSSVLADRQGIYDAVLNKSKWIGEAQLNLPAGRRKWVLLTVAPLTLPESSGKYFAVYIEDISERNQLQQQLYQAQKMEAIGTLTGGIAHDFNNLLTVINGHAEMLMHNLDKSNKRYSDVVSVYKAGKKAEKLTRQLLAFGRKQIFEPVKLDLNQSIISLKTMMQRLIGETIRIELEMTEPSPLIKADLSQVEQVLINLMVNARDAIHDERSGSKEGTIRIKTLAAAAYRPQKTGPVREMFDEYVCIQVSDTGCGISELNKQKIFEPFFTTKPKGKGTGLGLSTVYGIISQNNGIVEVDSREGEGTTFRIYWPACNDSSVPEPFIERDVLNTDIRVLRILVVEDDFAVREFTCEMLQELGHIAVSAEDGAQGLDLLRNAEQPFDILITDMVMPGIDGREVTCNALKIQPGIRVILSSGYAEQDMQRDLPADQGIRFMAKPYSIDKLARKLNEVMEPH